MNTHKLLSTIWTHGSQMEAEAIEMDERENVKERERIGREWMLQSAGLISLLFLMFASTWLCNLP